MSNQIAVLEQTHRPDAITTQEQTALDELKARIRRMSIEDVAAECVAHMEAIDFTLKQLAENAQDYDADTIDFLQYELLRHQRESAVCDSEITRRRRNNTLPAGQAATTITTELIRSIKSAANLVEVVESYDIDLRRRGARWTAKCPFHDDRTPSFVIFQDAGWKCFGCQKSGDVFTFVMLQDRVDFVTALRKLGEQYNIAVPERRGARALRQPARGNGNGHGHENHDGNHADEPANAQEGPVKLSRKRKLLTTAEYAEILQEMGYSFAYNLCTHVVEVNGEAMDENKDAEIRTRLRDAEINEVNVVADVMRYVAAQNQYHPVRDYLNALEWNGENLINQVAQHFVCAGEGDMFERFFKRWCIGAVARVMQDDAQNRVLLLSGAQGIGKDTFARWLCPLPAHYNDSPIRPDDKDHLLRLLAVWIWNVSEVGGTIRRQDREALKHLITIQQIRERKSYGRFDITGTAISSFIGSFNDDGSGVLNDSTGSRRFAIVPVLAIDWGYKQLDVNQLWAQAAALYRGGEPWDFAEDERNLANAVNDEFQVPDIVEETLKKYFVIDANDTQAWMSGIEIVETLKNPLAGNLKIADVELFRRMAAALTKQGLEKPRRVRSNGSQLRYYTGIKHKVRDVPDVPDRAR